MSRIFSSCPHDVASDPEKWVAFANYFKEKGIISSDFQRFMTFDDFASNFGEFSFVYAHPMHAVELFKKHGFIPLAKYSETYDEAAIIASKSIQDPKVELMHDHKVACVWGTPSHGAFLIDLVKNYPSVESDFIAKDTYPNVLMAVSIGEAQYGIVLKSVWDEMVSMKDRVTHFYTTGVKDLVHVFMLRPDLKSMVGDLKKSLLEMDKDPQGKQILGRLKCQSLISFDEEDMEKLIGVLSVCKF